MKRREFLTIIFLLSVFLLFLHLFALRFSLYWSIPSLDMIVHFVGGFTIVLLVLSLFFYNQKSIFSLTTLSLVISLLFSLGWELFENKIGFTFSSDNFASDTASDILLGVLGGFMAALFAKMISRKEDE